MKVCVVGSGGREHALAHVLARTADVVVTPGNPGMADPIRVTAQPAEEMEADLVVIGPEAPLVDGLADRLRADGRAVMGPGAAGALLEGSKAFMKQMLAEAGVPTARFAAFGAAERSEALAYLEQLPGPWVVKTDGLAAGKGVLVASTIEEARADVTAKLSGKAFGAAGQRVVIEEGLEGEECSLLVLFDGVHAVPLLPAQDFKRVGDEDRGPNTGGMGAYAPMPHISPEQVDSIMATAVEPLIATLRRRGIDYRGVLYAGLMLGEDGPKVIEYNVRFGDPETQVVLPLLSCDAAELFMAVATGSLRRVAPPTFSAEAAVCVVLASPGYPEQPADRWRHHRVGRIRPSDRGRRGRHGVPCRHEPARSGGALRDSGGKGPRGHGTGADAFGGPRARPTPRSSRSTGTACWSGATLPPGRPKIRMTMWRSWSDDPPLLACRHGGVVHRCRPLRSVARGRVVGDRGAGCRRGGAGRGCGDMPGQSADRR